MSIRIRDVVRHHTHQFPPTALMLRVPYDLFNPTGPVHYRNGLIEYEQAQDASVGRVAPEALGDANRGERVLLRIAPAAKDEWWLCEVEEIETAGQQAAH